MRLDEVLSKLEKSKSLFLKHIDNKYIIDLENLTIIIEKISFEALSDDLLSNSYPQDRYQITILQNNKITETLYYTEKNF